MISRMSQEIKNLWRIKAVGPQSILELRALNESTLPITKIFSGQNYSSDKELKLAFEQQAISLNEEGYNIYIVMNPIQKDFKGKSATDADIEYRDLLLIDIDKKGYVGEASTNAELEAARLLANKIADFMNERGWTNPIRVMSGNGHHLYYVLDNVDNSENSKQYIKDILKGLAARFDNEIVKVDTSVFNASRITKVVGTMARKGANTKERPHRMAKFYE